MKPSQLFDKQEIDGNIMLEKDKAEITNWTDDLEFIIEELDYLTRIVAFLKNNSEISQQLHSLRRENQLRLASLYKYEGSIQNALVGDAFYLHNHEKNRNGYVDLLKKYRAVKTKILSKTLENLKK